MKKIIALFNTGFQFGAGANAANTHPGFGFGGFGAPFARGFASRQVRPPYFAEFPPVYYNGIVRRPYGISPYAAPAGVVPVEMQVATESIEPSVVKNPFFNKNHSAPVAVTEIKEDNPATTKNKSTKIDNRFFESKLESSAPIMHASYDVEEN